MATPPIRPPIELQFQSRVPLIRNPTPYGEWTSIENRVGQLGFEPRTSRERPSGVRNQPERSNPTIGAGVAHLRFAHQ